MSLTVSKDGIILINFIHLKFRALNCLSISQPLKQLSENYLSSGVLKNICSENFLQIIIKTSVVGFILNKAPYFSEHL